jgi:hypothetical protein
VIILKRLLGLKSISKNNKKHSNKMPRPEVKSETFPRVKTSHNYVPRLKLPRQIKPGERN